MIFTNLTKYINTYKHPILKHEKIFKTSFYMLNNSVQMFAPLHDRSSYLCSKNCYYVSNYWKLQIFPHIQSKAQTVIEQLTNTVINQKQAAKKLVDYLEFKNQTFFRGRSPLGCMAVLAAMHASNNNAILTYSSRIIDFISEYDNKIDHLDQNMLFCYLKSHQHRQSQNTMKNKRSYFRSRFATMIKNHFNLINDNYLETFLTQIDQIMKIQKFNIINCMRYIQVFDKVQIRVCQLIQEYFSTSNSKRKNQITNLLNSEFIRKYNKLIRKFQFLDKKSAELLIKYIIQSPLLQEFSSQFIAVFAKIFNSIAYFYLPQENKTIRQKLVQLFQNRYQKHQYIKKLYQKTPQYNKTFIYQSYYMQILCKTFLNLKFVAIDDQFNVLYKNDFKKPVFCDFFLKLIKNDEQIIKYAFKNYEVLKQILPSNFTINQGIKQLDPKKMNKPIVTMQNQTNIRMQKVLKKMNLKYQKEFSIDNRSVDFLLTEQKIIIQMDGDYHLNSRTLEINMNTAFRNMQLLIQNYKLIVINIHEYNMNRSIQQLQKLLAKKIKLIQQNDIIYVQ